MSVLHSNGNKRSGRLPQEDTEFLQRSLEMSPFGVQVLTLDGRLVYANPTMLKMWGYDSLQQLSQVPLDQRFTPESIELIRTRSAKRRTEDVPSHHDLTIVCKDGGTRDLTAHSRELVWNGEKCVLAQYQDITERKQAESALVRKSDLLQAQAENSPDGIIAVDERGRIILCNQRFNDIWRVPPGISKSNDDLALVEHAATCVSDPESYLERLRYFGQNMQEIGIDEIPMKDGRIIERYSAPLTDSLGAYLGRIAYFRDISERKHAQDLYRSLADSSPVGICIVQDGRCVFANAAFLSMIGYSAGEVSNLSLLEIAHPLDRAGVMRHAQTTLEQGGIEPYEFRYLTRNGDTRRAVERVSRIMYRGKPAVLANLVDTTEIRRAQEALNEARQRYENLLDNVGVGIFVSSATKPGRFLSVNCAMEDITGYSREELLAITIEETHIDPGDRQQKLDRFEIDGPKVPIERLLKRKDSSLVLTRSWLTATKNESGKVVGYEGIMEDITERRRAQDALLRSEEKLRLMFESVAEGIIVADLDGTTVDVNQRILDIYRLKSRNDIIGKPTLGFVTMRDKEKVSATIAAIMNNSDSIDKVEASALRADGQEISVEVSVGVLKGATGLAIGYIATIRDVTETKRIQQQLLAQDRLASIGELVSGVAHEINNPLTGVLGFSQLLAEQDLPADVKERLKIISDEAQRAVRIVRDLLTFARKHTPVRQPSNINSIIEGVLRLRAYEHRLQGIEILRDLDPALPEADVDYFQMQQVFLNIIVNAEYFMIQAHNHGTLTVRTETRDRLLRVTIADDGPGIPPEDLSRIFDPFFTTKEVGKGTGLGLSICHGIITEHGGRIWAESESGSATFVIELPIKSHLPRARANTPRIDQHQRNKQSNS